MKKYPAVRNEFETVAQLVAGKSIGRLGDGEFAHVDVEKKRKDADRERTGAGRQAYDAALTSEMWRALHDPDPRFIVGIPTMDERGPKYRKVDANGRPSGWVKHEARFAAVLSPKVIYYSAFITRPDSAPWIDTVEFAEMLQSVWAGKRVCVVGKPTIKTLPMAKLKAADVHHIECPERDAYAMIDELQDRIYTYRPAVALLSAGPCATVLAHRLAKKGIQALDLGSAGAFLCRLLDA